MKSEVEIHKDALYETLRERGLATATKRGSTVFTEVGIRNSEVGSKEF